MASPWSMWSPWSLRGDTMAVAANYHYLETSNKANHVEHRRKTAGMSQRCEDTRMPDAGVHHVRIHE